MDNWQIDAAGCYKGLMLPTGTVYFAFSPKALQKLQPTHAADFWNLYYYKEAAKKGSYPYSPPVQLFYGADAALQYIENQGLAKIWNHAHLLSHYFKKEIIALGGSIFGETPADSLTAFSFEGQDLRKMKSFLKEKGIVISGGQDELGGKILRVSHLGIMEIAELAEVIAALREYLAHSIV
jgi:aspartate aminotransferase-like enzyme